MAAQEVVEREPRSSSNLFQKIERRIPQVLKGICLLGFPLILILIDLTGVHPSLPGRTGAEQIQKLAQSATRWAQVHFAFTVAGFFALGSILILRGMIARGSDHLPADFAAVVGVVGAVVFIGTVLMEVGVMPKLSTACAAAEPCLNPANVTFTEELANQGWRVLPGLLWGSRGIALGLLLLAALGGRLGALKVWEAVLLGAGGFYELVTPTGLHGWGTFSPEAGFTGITGVMVLAASAGICYRLFLRVDGASEDSIATTEPGPQGESTVTDPA